MLPPGILFVLLEIEYFAPGLSFNTNDIFRTLLENLQAVDLGFTNSRLGKFRGANISSEVLVLCKRKSSRTTSLGSNRGLSIIAQLSTIFVPLLESSDLGEKKLDPVS